MYHGSQLLQYVQQAIKDFVPSATSRILLPVNIVLKLLALSWSLFPFGVKQQLTNLAHSKPGMFMLLLLTYTLALTFMLIWGKMQEFVPGPVLQPYLRNQARSHVQVFLWSGAAVILMIAFFSVIRILYEKHTERPHAEFQAAMDKWGQVQVPSWFTSMQLFFFY